MASSSEHPPLLPDTLKRAQECALAMKVHSRQCVLLCNFVINALSAGSPANSGAEAGQQWDDALTDMYKYLANWSKLDIIQGFLQADQIRLGVDKLYEELRWCGLSSETLQLSEKRRQDEDALQEILRKIVSSPELLARIMTQPPRGISYFITKLQRTLREGRNADSARSYMESALMSLYKNAEVQISTPDLTTQISDISSMPTASSKLYSTYDAEWLGKEKVTLKALKLVRYNSGAIKRFRKDVSAFFSIRHQNIIRVYGMSCNEVLGFCLVLPPMGDSNALSHLEQCGDTNVVSWLYDIATALQFLHALPTPVICGYLQAESILIKDDGTGVYISDVGILQLSCQISNKVEGLFRWCAPEVIRAARKKEDGDDMTSAFSKQTDIYSFGMLIFELFTSEAPFYYITDKETLEPEIIHGTRPTMSQELKAKANRRGFSSDIHTLNLACWDADPTKRPIADILVEKFEIYTNAKSRTKSETMHDRPGSSSSASVMSRMSRSTNSSMMHPVTPRSPPSLIANSPVSIVEHPDTSSSPEQSYFSASQIFSEPASIEIDHRPLEREMSTEVLRKMSAMSVHTQQTESEQTIRLDPHATFSSDSSDGSHLGQRENSASAYERMPKLKAPSLSSTRRRNSKDRFEIIVSRMTVDGEVNPNWVGVASMESLRGITRRSSKLTQVTAVEKLIERETRFLADKMHEYLPQYLHANPAILGVRLESFLSSVFEDSHALRLVNYHFRNALQASSNVSVIGFTRIALLCKEAATQFCMVYPDYIWHLPEVRKVVADEMDSNDRFSAFMKEKQSDGRTLQKALDDFLHAPITHLDQHHRTLQLIINGMNSGDPETPVLQEAYQEMVNAVNAVHLSRWQQNNDKKDWKDFVSAEMVKRASKADVSRQTNIFELIADERDYVVKLKALQKVLQSILRELGNLRRKEDANVQELMKSLIAVFADFLRFHGQLLENLFTLQRSQHPYIGAFVTACGIDQIPWHSLYDHRFGTCYRKLVEMMLEVNVRSGIFKRVMQDEPFFSEEVDFMSILRTPSLHLRVFVSRLRTISELSSEGSEDRQAISEIFPRLWDVSRQVELKTSLNKERARLSSLATALDFSSHPGIESDIDIRSSSRTLVMYGTLKLGVTGSHAGRIATRERSALLLDNYLLFTEKADIRGFLRLHVCEKPLPLDLINLSADGIPSTASSNGLFPCIRVRYVGHDPIYLFAETENAARIWREKLLESQAIRVAVVEKARAIDMEILDRFPNTPSCSAEFSYAGKTVLAIALETVPAGVWLRQGNDQSARHAVALNGITSLTVLNETGILLVLAEQSLFWYRLEVLMKGGRVPQRNIDENMTVDFYRTGKLADRTFLVVSAKKKGKNLLRFFEAAEGRMSSKMRNAFSGKSGVFNLVTEVELTYFVKDIYFLRNSFVLVSDKFRIVNFSSDPQKLKENLTSGSPTVLPLPDDPLTDLADRCRSSTPLAIHTFDKDYILCYKEFASYINVNGQLSPKVVEWESKDARNVIFRSPYMLILSASMVEIRQIATGKLEQLVAAPGHIQLSWERRHDEKDSVNLGIHLLMGVGADAGTSNQWYTLDGNHPNTLFRLLRR